MPEATPFTVQPFYGKIPPFGWAWCDGKNRTPDMNNMGLMTADGKPAKFIMKLAVPQGILMIDEKQEK